MPARDQHSMDDDWLDSDAESQAEDSEDEPTVPCRYCRREILEDCDRCPYCEQYISSEDGPPISKPRWIIAGTLLCLFLAYWWIFS